MSSSNTNTQKFTNKEQQEIQFLKEIMESRSSSVNERQIAEAKLYDLEKSKEPAPHNHKHRLERGEVGGETKVTSSNMMHNDEAFEKFEMGGDSSFNRAKGSSGSRVHNQAAADQQSILMNHKARGTAKERSNDTILDGEFSLHGPQ